LSKWKEGPLENEYKCADCPVTLRKPKKVTRMTVKESVAYATQKKEHKIRDFGAK
jgi:hypothetical protein